MADDLDDKKKRHNKRASGRKADKKTVKDPHVQELTAKQRNPKAFTVRSAVSASKALRRSQDLKEKRTHIPVIDRTTLEPPPIVISIVGPPKVGKTTLLRSLIKNFTRKNLTDIQGPVTVVSGKKRRLTFMECNNDINSMIDIAKVTDLVLLLVDASFGFEMETFEFLNICQVHGFPRVMGVLTHLDMFRDNKKLRKIKKTLKHRFWTDVYPGAKLFYLSSLVHGVYQRMEVHNLGRFIAVMKFRPLDWRQNHPYLLVDRLEDLTPADRVRRDAKCDRRVCVYGYVRGVPLRADTPVHLAGVGDFRLASVDFLPDPCPLPERSTKSRRSLNERERSLYAPMSGVGGIVYDKDAVYIELGGSHSHTVAGNTDEKESLVDGQADADATSDDRLMMKRLKDPNFLLDERLANAELKVFSDLKALTSQEAHNQLECEAVTDVNGRARRRVVFDDLNNNDADDDEENDSHETDDSDVAEDTDEEAQSSDGGHSDAEDDTVKSNDIETAGSRATGDQTAAMGCARITVDKFSRLCLSDLSLSQNAKQLRRLIYDDTAASSASSSQAVADVDSDGEVGGLFRVRRHQRNDGVDCDRRDTCRPSWLNVRVAAWTDATEAAGKCRRLLAACFTSDVWKQPENAAALLNMAVDDLLLHSSDDDGNEGADFEDLETGECHTSARKSAAVAGQSTREEQRQEEETRRQLVDNKRRLKAEFDRDYDSRESSGFYDDLKRDLEQQAQLNRSEFAALPDCERVRYEGYRAGMYVRLEVDAAPAELIRNFDATYPLVMGGLAAGEQNIGYVQARVKRHRWYGSGGVGGRQRTLKSRDPLIVSLGWRRFQTAPLYSACDHNGRHRLLKYTPDHIHCMAHFFGPATPQGSGMLALQQGAAAGFRVAVTGVVLDLDRSVRVVKKLKLVGEPLRVLKRTAFVGGMFGSAVEAARFEGALCRTVAGVRGHVKRALVARPGVVRCTFEDAVRISDLVFVRTWCAVQVPRLYAPVSSLLLPSHDRGQWRGMRTVGELKRERGVQVPAAADSLYTPVVRRERRPARPLHVPAQLLKQLPYGVRIRLNRAGDGSRYAGVTGAQLTADGQPAQAAERRQPLAVVLQPREQRVQRVLGTVRALHGLQEERRQVVAARRAALMTAKHRQQLDKFERRQKRVRQHLYRVLAKQQQTASKTVHS